MLDRDVPVREQGSNQPGGSESGAASDVLDAS